MFATAESMAQNYPRSGILPPNFDQGTSSSGDDDTTLAGLKEIVSKQQREIENHQQQLVAKEQRLKFLKQPDTLQMSQDAISTMRDKVAAQEQKLERLRELKGKVDQQRSLNISELDSVKALFKEKEHELMEAVTKVDTLSKQLDTIKNSHLVKGDSINITTGDLAKLKTELRMTQDMNEQKNHELAVQLNLLNQRNKQVDYLDKRIEELQARLRKKKQAEQNSVILAPQKTPYTNVATVEPSIRIEPLPASSSNITKVPLVPNPNDPRYQTLPNNFKYAQNYYHQPSIYNPSKLAEKIDEKPVGQYKLMRDSPELKQQVPPTRQTDDIPRGAMPPPRQPPMYISSIQQPPNPEQSRPMYTSASQLPNRPLSTASYMGDANNNNSRRSSSTSQQPSASAAVKDQLDAPSYRPNAANTPVNQPYKPMYASRSVIADTYMKRLGPKPMYKAMAPHSIPAFHLQNSIISDKVSSKNNTLRSLRRRHSYTETDETKIEVALGPRDITPGSSTPPATETSRDSPKTELEKPVNTSNSSHNSSTSSDEPKIPNSGIVARQILKKEIGVKRNLDRRVTFDPHALLLDASLEGEFELVQRSASQVPDASQPNDEGITALHNAICAGHFDIVKFLVKFGVDVNSQDIDGWTPLHCASSCNNLPMVKFLVEHGACIYALTISDHETPAEKCEEDDDDGCSQYLYGIQEKLGVLNNGTVYALFDYRATRPDELSFKNGEKLTVLRTNKEEREWWWASSDGTKKEGYIPRTFLGLFPRVAA